MQHLMLPLNNLFLMATLLTDKITGLPLLPDEFLKKIVIFWEKSPKSSNL